MTVDGREKRGRLARAFPPTPESFDARMRETLAHLPPRRRTARRTVLIAVAALLAAALCGIAVAASPSHLLELLFFGSAPTPEAERLLTPARTAVERDGVLVTVDEYLLDGADLYVRWTVENRRGEPLLLMVSDLDAGGAAMPIGEDNLADWLFASGVLLDAAHPAYSATSRLNFDDSAPERAFDVSFTASLLRPLAPVTDCDSAEASGGAPVFLTNEIDGRTVYDAVSGIERIDGGLAMHTPLEALKDGWSLDALVDVLAAQGYAEEVARIPVTFRVAPDGRNIVHTDIVGARTFTFDDFTLTVERADFTAAGREHSLPHPPERRRSVAVRRGGPLVRGAARGRGGGERLHAEQEQRGRRAGRRDRGARLVRHSGVGTAAALRGRKRTDAAAVRRRYPAPADALSGATGEDSCTAASKRRCALVCAGGGRFLRPRRCALDASRATLYN